MKRVRTSIQRWCGPMLGEPAPLVSVHTAGGLSKLQPMVVVVLGHCCHQSHWISPSTCDRSNLNCGLLGSLQCASSKSIPRPILFNVPAFCFLHLSQGLCTCWPLCQNTCPSAPCTEWPLASFRTFLHCYLFKTHPPRCPLSCSIPLSCLTVPNFFIVTYKKVCI